MRESPDHPDRYECVLPETGNQIWRLELADTPPDVRTELEHHLAVCDSCRLTRAMHDLVKESAAEQSVDFGADKSATPQGPWKRPSQLAMAGSLALAASLVLALVLPPSQFEQRQVRGDSGPGIERPVEGEVLLTGTPELSWTPIPGATSYRIEVTGIGTDYHWSGQSVSSTVILGVQSPLPKNQKLRAVVQTVPDDLVPLGSLSVVFQRAGPGGFLAYRLRATLGAVKILGSAGLVLLALSLVRSRRRSPVPG